MYVREYALGISSFGSSNIFIPNLVGIRYIYVFHSRNCNLVSGYILIIQKDSRGPQKGSKPHSSKNSIQTHTTPYQTEEMEVNHRHRQNITRTLNRSRTF